MTKPLFTSYTPDDDGLLNDLQSIYGSQLEDLSKREKLFLIQSLAAYLCVSAPGEVRNEVFAVALEINQQLSAGDRVGLIQCLVAGVKHGRN